MAISTAAYSPKEFQVLIAEQDAFGTIEADGGNAYHAIDVDSIGSPSLNPSQALDVRAGSRVLQATDFFQYSIASVKDSVSVSPQLSDISILIGEAFAEAASG